MSSQQPPAAPSPKPACQSPPRPAQGSGAAATGNRRGSFPPHSAKKPEPQVCLGPCQTCPSPMASPASPHSGLQPWHPCTRSASAWALFFLTPFRLKCHLRPQPPTCAIPPHPQGHCFHGSPHTPPGTAYQFAHWFIFCPCPSQRGRALVAFFFSILATAAPDAERLLHKHSCRRPPGLPAQCSPALRPQGLPPPPTSPLPAPTTRPPPQGRELIALIQWLSGDTPSSFPHRASHRLAGRGASVLVRVGGP